MQGCDTLWEAGWGNGREVNGVGACRDEGTSARDFRDGVAKSRDDRERVLNVEQ